MKQLGLGTMIPHKLTSRMNKSTLIYSTYNSSCNYNRILGRILILFSGINCGIGIHFAIGRIGQKDEKLEGTTLWPP